MRAIVFASVLFGLAAVPGAAFAEGLGRPCTDKPESQYLTLEALKAKVAEQGYQIRSGEIRKACGEFYVLDKSGKRAELFVDPTTGKIVAGDGKGVTGMTDGSGGTQVAAASGDRDADKGAADAGGDGGKNVAGDPANRDGGDKDGDD